jgi:AAA family ATP:ADP antiporter
MKSVGITTTLIAMPVLSLFGFAAIGYRPELSTLAIFQVMRRAAAFAFMRPAREVLFTVLRREDKYKAKTFMDTFGYRSGDQLGAWSYSALQAIGLGLSAISFVAVPVIAVWCAVGVWLGRKQIALAKERQEQADGRAA